MKARWVLFLCGLPYILAVSWPLVLLAKLRWGGRLRWEEGRVLTVELPRRPVLIGSTIAITCGYGIIYASGCRAPFGMPDNPVQRHEHVHVKQFEGWAAAGVMAGAVALVLGAPVLSAFAVWAAAPAFAWAGHTLTAWLRGGSPYWDAAHEEAARAIASSKAD